jgi:hypothetical protein
MLVRVVGARTKTKNFVALITTVSRRDGGEMLGQTMKRQWLVFQWK